MALPDAPVNISTDPFNATVTVSWDAVPSIINYIVEYSTDKVNWIEFEADESTDTTRTVNPLVNNQPYHFRVNAVNTEGAGDFSLIVTSTPENVPVAEYCSAGDIADWLRIDINANTDPNSTMIDNVILMNQERIDRLTGHTWQTDKQYRYEEFDLNRIWFYGKGMPLFMAHRQMRLPFDPSKGDLVEIWDGLKWAAQDIAQPDQFIFFDAQLGIFYIRGYFFSIFNEQRFRLTYRYGGDQQGEPVPRDIKKACILMTAMDILSTDFKMSQIAYGGEGNVNKKQMMDKWQEEIDSIIWSHSEILTVYS